MENIKIKKIKPEKILVCIRIEKNLFKRLKMFSVAEETSVQELITSSVEKLLTSSRLP